MLMRAMAVVALVTVAAILLFWLGGCTPAEGQAAKQGLALGPQGVCFDPAPLLESVLAEEDDADAGDDGGTATIAFAVTVPKAKHRRAKRCPCADAGERDARPE